MILYKFYDSDAKAEEAWLDSSMIYYTRMVEDGENNKGDLYVVFKNGSMYKYKDVEFSDYVIFIGGGTDASQGKTLNKVIKPKYDFEKCESADMEKLDERMKLLVENERNNEYERTHTYFVSGYEDVSDIEFEVYYQPRLMAAADDEENRFVVSDRPGCDLRTQCYLLEVLSVNPERVTVFHEGESPVNFSVLATKFNGGFETRGLADGEMTKRSAHDIAFVRGDDEDTNVSRNILRRFVMNV